MKGQLQAITSNPKLFHKELNKHGLPWVDQGLPVTREPALLICTSSKERCKPLPARIRTHDIKIMLHIITKLRVSLRTV